MDRQKKAKTTLPLNKMSQENNNLIITQKINQTIVITYDDGTRMVDFCKNKEDVISKEFYDWYLGNGNFFSKVGVLIIDGLLGEKERVAVSFNFDNPDSVEFNVYHYKTQSLISKFLFYRQQNPTMENLSVDIKYFSPQTHGSQTKYWMNPETKEMITKNVKKISNEAAAKIRKGHKGISAATIKDSCLKMALQEINVCNCKTLVYFTYGLMFFIAQQKQEEITSFLKDATTNEGEVVKSIYKYSGYIDLRKNKVYKPIIKKDPNDPIREYQRHIQKWTVRGHYRKTKNGLIWIEPQIRGNGELEKRIYGTENEKDLNLQPKVFEVAKTRKVNKVEVKNEKHDLNLKTNIKTESEKPQQIEGKKNYSFIKNLWIKILSILFKNH